MNKIFRTFVKAMIVIMACAVIIALLGGTGFTPRNSETTEQVKADTILVDEPSLTSIKPAKPEEDGDVDSSE